jgi:hypothetical protein
MEKYTFFEKRKAGLTPRQQLATCCLQHFLVMTDNINKKCCRQHVANCCLGVRRQGSSSRRGGQKFSGLVAGGER